MPKYSLKFWIIFWITSVTFLAGWFFYLNFWNKEKTFMLLFQNNLELRPGGGFIGAFGILKVRSGRIVSLETHDLSNFDDSGAANVPPPYPIGEIMHVNSWKLRDSNWSPDFATDAQKAEEIYHASGGQEKFDGIIGITSNTLASMLKVTGPIEVNGYPGSYDSGNAIISLEYQVEKAFEQQGIEREHRKSVMNDLAREIEEKVLNFSVVQKLKLIKVLLADLSKKDIQIYFQNASMQKIARSFGWTGSVDQDWNKDFLMAVDANLGAFKSDYYMKRSLDYTIDLSKDVPQADLKITYNHTALQKDWMTRNYLTYLRVYVPQGSVLQSSENFDDPQTGEDLGKTYFGAIVIVPINSSKTVELNYALPKELGNNYALKIQKQAGLDDVPLTVHVIGADGQRKDYSYKIDKGEYLLNGTK
ncbi:MAG TPA: DUF4012 domain-containing protein [Patescibacteria group bacterium]